MDFRHFFVNIVFFSELVIIQQFKNQLDVLIKTMFKIEVKFAGQLWLFDYKRQQQNFITSTAVT
jgi:hypothetical protein